MVPRQAELIR